MVAVTSLWDTSLVKCKSQQAILPAHSQIQSPLTLIPLSTHDLQPLIPYLCVAAASPSQVLLTVPDNTVNASPGSSAHCPLIHPGTQSKAWHTAALPLMIQDQAENTKGALPQLQPSFSSALCGAATELLSAHIHALIKQKKKRKRKGGGSVEYSRRGEKWTATPDLPQKQLEKYKAHTESSLTHPPWFYKKK